VAVSIRLLEEGITKIVKVGNYVKLFQSISIFLIF
jgi:hypothetical protein